MSDESILDYSINQIKFIKRGPLQYQGVHSCYVSKKETHKKGIHNHTSVI